jgi:hypothetical protein
MEKLDRLTLQKRLDQIGGAADSPDGSADPGALSARSAVRQPFGTRSQSKADVP